MPGSSTLPPHHAGQVQIPKTQPETATFSKTLKNQLKFEKKKNVNKQQNYLALSNSKLGIDQSKQQIH